MFKSLKSSLLAFLLTCIFGLTGGLLSGCFKERLYHTQSYVFGTLVDISIYGETDDRARFIANHVLQDFQNLHNRLHAWKPVSEGKPSELGELNAAFSKSNKPIAINTDIATAALETQTALSLDKV